MPPGHSIDLFLGLVVGKLDYHARPSAVKTTKFSTNQYHNSNLN